MANVRIGIGEEFFDELRRDGCYYVDKTVKSDQENDLGRTDIVIKDRKNRRAIIIETKKAEEEKDLEKMSLEGRQQIIRKKYFKGLKGYTRIICYGISFFEKTAKARLFQIDLEPSTFFNI